MKKAIGVTLLFLALSAPALAGSNSGDGGSSRGGGGGSFGSTSAFTPMAPMRVDPAPRERIEPVRMAPERRDSQPDRKIWIRRGTAANYSAADYIDQRCVRPTNVAIIGDPLTLSTGCRQYSYYGLWSLDNGL
jgi:hypothetical protein